MLRTFYLYSQAARGHFGVKVQNASIFFSFLFNDNQIALIQDPTDDKLATTGGL